MGKAYHKCSDKWRVTSDRSAKKGREVSVAVDGFALRLSHEKKQHRESHENDERREVAVGEAREPAQPDRDDVFLLESHHGGERQAAQRSAGNQARAEERAAARLGLFFLRVARLLGQPL